MVLVLGVPCFAFLAAKARRVDVGPDGSGCDVIWESDARSATVVRLSTAAGPGGPCLRESGDE